MISNASQLTQIDVWERDSRVYKTDFNQNSTFIALGDGGTAQVLAPLVKEETGSEVVNGSFILGIVFSPDDTLWILIGDSSEAGNSRTTFRLRDITSNSESAVLSLDGRETINDMEFNRNGSCIAFASSFSKIRLWNVSSGTEQVSLSAQNIVTTIAFNPDGSLLAYGTDGDNDSSGDVVVGVWDLERNEEIHAFRGHSNGVSKVAFSPNGELLASSSWDGTIRLWDITTGAELSVLQGHTDGVTDIAFGADGSIIASGSRDNTIRLWDVSTGQHLSSLDAHNPIIGLAFLPDMSLLISVEANGTIQYWGKPNAA